MAEVRYEIAESVTMPPEAASIRARLKECNGGALELQCEDRHGKWRSVVHLFNSGKYGLSSHADSVPGLLTDDTGCIQRV